MNTPVSYRTMQIDGLSIFYREVGPKDAPARLLPHSPPSSSRMYEPLLQRLSDRYHLIAPDYPGFGPSDWPDHTHCAYPFDHIAVGHGPWQIVSGLTPLLEVALDRRPRDRNRFDELGARPFPHQLHEEPVVLSLENTFACFHWLSWLFLSASHRSQQSTATTVFTQIEPSRSSESTVFERTDVLYS